MYDNKIAIIEPVGGHGGMDFYNYGLALGLAKNKWNVHIFTSGETSERIYENVSTHKTFKKVWSRKNKAIKLLYFLIEHLISYRKAKRKGISILHFHFFELDLKNYLALKLAKRFKFKLVVTIHDVSSFQGVPASNFSVKIAAMADKIIVHNTVSAKEVIELGLTNEPVIIPHGNYLPFIESVKGKDKNESSPLNILFFGQIKEVKGLEILLNALGEVKADSTFVKLTIAGKIWKDNPKKYEQLIQRLGIDNMVECHYNYIPNEEVGSYFKNTDLVVLPYKKIYQSGVLLLSMSYGRPVLVSDLEAFTEIIEDNENGFIFKQNSAEDLARKLEYICNNKEQLDLVASNANQLLVDKFDWIKIGVQTIEKVYSIL